jgi:hypothetical protein
MLHPELIQQHANDCKALDEVRKGTLVDPWSHTPMYDMEHGELVFSCTGCLAKMKVKLSEITNYSDSYINGIFE